MKKAQIFYADIGDYLTREQKLKILKDAKSIENIKMTEIHPNDAGDWINQRNDEFAEYIALGDKDDKNNNKTFFDTNYSRGMATGQDARLINFGRPVLKQSIDACIQELNQVVEEVNKKLIDIGVILKSIINHNVSWTDELKIYAKRGFQFAEFDKSMIENYIYRPFCKSNIYNYKPLITRTYQMPKIFPKNENNVVISVSGIGATKDFMPFIESVKLFL